VREVFAEEHPRLLALPADPFPCEDREETTVRRWPYVRFDLNDYSVPYTYVRRAVVVYATLDTVRIVDGPTVLARHPRSFDQGQQIEQPAHVAELVAFKRAARHHRGLDRLHHACANTAAFFAALAARQGNLGAATAGLLTLLDLYGASAVDAALGAAVHAQAVHLAAVRQILEQRRYADAQPPPIAVTLSEPALRDLVVHPHALTTYDQIDQETADDDDAARG
jgi:hypothetical protein